MPSHPLNNLEALIIEIRNQKVILDSDVAAMYGVETKRINEAVQRNRDKFPEGYILELDKNEKQEVVAICDHLNDLKFSPNLPKAFTEKGLYMLATILKSKQATQATLQIIETFAKVREFSRVAKSLAIEKDGDKQQTLSIKAASSSLIFSIKNLPEIPAVKPPLNSIWR